MDNRITEVWEQLCDFTVFRNSLDLGGLSKLIQLFSQGSSQDAKSFADQIVSFVEAVSQQAKARPFGQANLLCLLIIDTLLTNLYSYCRNGQQLQPNSSSFYGWMSSSQMSMDQSNMSERDGQLILDLVKVLANSEVFFKRLKISLQKSRNQEKTKRYVEYVLQSIDYILSKQHISRQNFLKHRGKYVGLEGRKKYQIYFGKVNKVIFSPQLNRIEAILTQGPDSVHLSLLRIYLFKKQDSQVYKGVQFSGQEMLINLYRYYISSFKDLQELFQEGKHPLFRLLRNHFALLYTFVLRRFHQLVTKVSGRSSNSEGYQFFKTCKEYFMDQIMEYIHDIPSQLIRLLSQLKDLVQEQHPNQGGLALSSVKKLFFYSFILDQSTMEELYPRHDPTKYASVYNHIVNLFFGSSLKKYSNLPESQYSVISQIVDSVSSYIDDRIINGRYKVDSEQNTVQSRQSIINYDYDKIMSVLAKLQFTPKDSKQFEMKKISPLAPQSPIYKHFKTQAFATQQRQQQLQLATWMSVGGSRDWSQSPQSRPARQSVSQRLKGFGIIDASTRSRLASESESFLFYLPK